MLVSRGFIFLETMYTGFHLDEILLLSFFINSLPCHKKSYVAPHLLKMKLPLGVALITYNIIMQITQNKSYTKIYWCLTQPKGQDLLVSHTTKKVRSAHDCHGSPALSYI
jgi:hypothetical protein